ncbi:anti-sigma factor family protein [Parathermosynechococcus lividus]
MMDELDHCKRDHFELLSAYLDGEVTAGERQQVEAWLASDPKAQRLYQRLLTLKAQMQQLPVPVSPCPTDYLAARVIAKAQRRPRAVWVWGGVGATLAASVVGVLNGLLPNPLPGSQIAVTSPASIAPEVSPVPVEPTAVGLMLSLDRPPVAIPVSETAPAALAEASTNTAKQD